MSGSGEIENSEFRVRKRIDVLRISTIKERSIARPNINPAVKVRSDPESPLMKIRINNSQTIETTSKETISFLAIIYSSSSRDEKMICIKD
jgi:hypothetical protein